MVVTDRPVYAPTSPFFGHPQVRPPEAAAHLTDATRQLCCGAYVDSSFANAVISEVVEDEHRTVPLALDADFDLDPVVRHCYRARRLLLARDLFLTLLVVIGIVITPSTTLPWLTLGVIVLASRTRYARSLGWFGRLWLYTGLAVGGVVVTVVGSLVLTLLAVLFAAGAAESNPDLVRNLGDQSNGAAMTGLKALYVGFLLSPLVLAFLTFAVIALFRLRAYGVLTRDLAPGRPSPMPPLPNQRVARRMDWVAGAQRGNLAMNSTDPFLGAGVVTHTWSFALPLTPVDRDRPRPVPLDPVRLNQLVRASLQRLRDPALPPGERIPGLYLLPYVAATSARRQSDALVEPGGRRPYTLASPAAIEAIIRHPQGSLRYYQRAVVGAEGKSVRTPDNVEVVPAQDQQLAMSIFVHTAVEGGMLYVEFVAAVLPPPTAEFHLLDALHTSAERLLVRSLRDAWRSWPGDCAAAPWRALRSIWRIATAGWRMNRAGSASREFRVYDYGARFSVRELAAVPVSLTFLQGLDADKYIKLAERAATDAIGGYLTEAGVDLAEFGRQVSYVLNAQTINNTTTNVRGNTFNGPAAFGSGANASGK
jgi:hypothetical protein